MLLASPQLSRYRYRPTLRIRATAAVLSLAICVLILIGMIMMGAIAPGNGKPGAKLVAITIGEKPESKSEHKQADAKAASVTAPQPVPKIPTPEPLPKPPAVPPLNLLHMTRQDMAAADISRMPKRGAPGADTGADTGLGTSGAGAYGPGEGPGGARLYNAEWHREPSHAEIAGYLPRGAAPGAWATIACRTIDHYRVDNCVQLSESPLGSGLSRALRQAAWQFLVRPPRLNGKPMVGTWVRIRFDFTRAPASKKDDDAASSGDDSSGG